MTSSRWWRGDAFRDHDVRTPHKPTQLDIVWLTQPDIVWLRGFGNQTRWGEDLVARLQRQQDLLEDLCRAARGR